MTIETADPQLASPAMLAPVDSTVIERIDLATRVALLTGATAWTLTAIPELGLRSLVMSDGPVGVRDIRGIAGEASRLFPAPSAVAATWDPIAATGLGRIFAREARAHGVDVVLAPQVNIQRTPVAGRHFECFSEDPLLTSSIASAIIGGMQGAGVAATIKHYVANDSETARTGYTAKVSEQAMREVFLAPFEHAVREAGVWSVMAAYSGVDYSGEHASMTEHRALTLDLLKGEWGFDGVVVSDWLATTSTVASALGGLDLVMPGPTGPWGERLVSAVDANQVPEAVIDDKVARILRLADRTGARGRAPVDPGTSDDDDRFLRDLAARSTVVLRREGSLPRRAEGIGRVALIGPNAVDAYLLGGGSSSVAPKAVTTPLQGLVNALPDAEITLHRGGDARRHLPVLDEELCRDPRDGVPGVRVSLLDSLGAELDSEVVGSWTGWMRDLPADVDAVRVETVLERAEPGRHEFAVGTLGRYRVELDGQIVASADRAVGAEVVLDSSINSPDGVGGVVMIDRSRPIRLTATLGVIHADGYGDLVRGELRHRPPGPDLEAEIEDAVAAASVADLVIVIVGTNDEIESEGWDRDTLALPGRQDELVRRVLDVAPDAVIAVNAGAPVILPWLDDARTVLWTWFPGQACGDALADVIFGRTEPAGRLPWTLPAREEDVPVPHARPDGNLVVDYTEGVHVGYRGWERAGRIPAREFGFGLGWTDWRYDAADRVEVAPDGVRLEVGIRNTGRSTGTETLQVYLESPDAATRHTGATGGPTSDDPAAAHHTYDRPRRWLGGFATITVDPGATAAASVIIPRRAFEVWDTAAASWVLPTGTYPLLVGRSVRDIRLRTSVTYETT